MTDTQRAGHEYGGRVFDSLFTAQLAATAPPLAGLAAQLNTLNALAYGVATRPRDALHHGEQASSMGRELAEHLVKAILDQPLRATPCGRVLVDDGSGQTNTSAIFYNRILIAPGVQEAVAARLAAATSQPSPADAHPETGRPYSEHYDQLPYGDGRDLALEVWGWPPAYDYLVPYNHASPTTESD